MVQDKNAKLKGRFLEKIGTYRPSTTNEYLVFNNTRYDEWLKLGAIPSPRMAKLYREFLVKNPEAKTATTATTEAAPKKAKAPKAEAPVAAKKKPAAAAKSTKSK